MMFKDLKPGYPIYVLDINAVVFKTGKVKSVGISRLDSRIGSPTEMVVDVDVEINGATKSLVLKDANETAYSNELMFSTNKDSVLREVEVIKNQSEDALSKIDQYKINVDHCIAIMSELNPAEKEKKQIEDRFLKIEGSQERIESALAELLKELKS